MYAVREYNDGERQHLHDSHTGSKHITSVTPHRIDLMQTMNYTDYLPDVNFFFHNSMSINMSILAFQILDYIMQRPKNKNMYPLPKNKQFLLQTQNIAVIVQLLLVENNDLTRCILVFILRHLDSHYALFQLRQSGIVEFLMLQLDNQTLTRTDYETVESVPYESGQTEQDFA